MENRGNQKFRTKMIGAGLFVVFALIISAFFSIWQERKRNANESNTAYFINLVRESQNKYASVHQGAFALNFDELIESGGLDEKFSGEKPTLDGYVFEMRVVSSTNTKPAFYSINADPKIPEGLFSTGTRHFYYDCTLGSTRSTEENRQAKANDPTI